MFSNLNEKTLSVFINVNYIWRFSIYIKFAYIPTLEYNIINTRVICFRGNYSKNILFQPLELRFYSKQRITEIILISNIIHTSCS